MNKDTILLSRRQLLKAGGAATFMVFGGALIHNREAWGLETKNLSPQTMQTLIQMARDIYPHDRFPDRIYAQAVKAYDEAASEDADLKTMIENGVSELDRLAAETHGISYVDVGWEKQRNELLRMREDDPLFQKLRGDLVTGVYNNHEVWGILGYEGESFSKGGYLERGFDDIQWL